MVRKISNQEFDDIFIKYSDMVTRLCILNLRNTTDRCVLMCIRDRDYQKNLDYRIRIAKEINQQTSNDEQIDEE